MGSPSPIDLSSLVHLLLAELGQQHNATPFGEEVRDSLSRSLQVEPQLEETIAEGPRVRHAKGRTLLGGSLYMERDRPEGHDWEIAEPFLHLRLQLDVPH
jgi:hypothetical protein